MKRKRIRHELVEGEKKRNGIFTKRSEGLLKKANELSILCSVDVAVVAHRRGGENNVILWPSPAAFHANVDRFMKCSSEERGKKMVTHEGFMEHMVKIEAGAVDMSRKTIQMKEGRQVLNGVATSGGGGWSLEILNLIQLNQVNQFAKEMLKMLQKRREEELQKISGCVTAPTSLISSGSCCYVRTMNEGTPSYYSQIADDAEIIRSSSPELFDF